jgi:hypothetical protein
MISTRASSASGSGGQRKVFLLVCAAAGPLAVPAGWTVTPAAAAVALLVAMVGLKVWRWSGLATPTRTGRPILWMAVGFAMGLVLLAVIRLAIEPVLPQMGRRIAAAGALPFWRRGIIIYVAAVTEELLFRLLLFSAIAGLLARLRRRPGNVPRSGDGWIANGVSALAFALVHLPAWGRSAPTTAGVVVSVLALNAAAGLVLGHVFAWRGIAMAIWAHAGGDSAIQLVGPLTG